MYGHQVPDAGLVDEPERVEHAPRCLAIRPAVTDLQPPVVPDRPSDGSQVTVITSAIMCPTARIEVKPLLGASRRLSQCLRHRGEQLEPRRRQERAKP
jgi:hypothetical protein